MEHQHASGPVSAEHTKQHGVVGVGLSIDSTGTDEGNNNNNSTGRKTLDLNPLRKIAQKFSKVTSEILLLEVMLTMRGL